MWGLHSGSVWGDGVARMKQVGDLDWYLLPLHEVPVQSLLESCTMLLPRPPKERHI